MLRVADPNRSPPLAMLLAGLLALAAAGPAAAQAPADVVPISAEPSHKVRFDNGTVRVYEVLLQPGAGTLMHEHRADSFSVILRDAEMRNEPHGGFAMSFPVPAGFVGFASTANGPYAHRIVASGPTPFHVVALELLGSKPSAPPLARRDARQFDLLTENSRGRAYGYTLAPGQSTGPFSRQVACAVIAVSAGRVTEAAEGEPPRPWEFEPGNVRWIGANDKVIVKNDGAVPVRLVEIEVF